MALRFGTDGIRGVANAELTPELVMALGRAAARVLPSPRFVIGRDTRQSGPYLQAALSAGLASEGVSVTDLGVLPTPAIAWCSARDNVPAAVVSASHNPFADNGIKLFAAGGLKLPTATEERIEAVLEAQLDGAGLDGRHRGAATDGLVGVSGRDVGVLDTDPSVIDGYVAHLLEVLGGRRLDGLRIVHDAANGAASFIGPQVLAKAGADVVAISCRPDGTNINDGCGATHPEQLAAYVVAVGADLGLAVDGDADRLVAVTHTGQVTDGDELLALFAGDLADRGLLRGDTVVVTVMSNLGLRHALAARGLAVLETGVGDRQVLEALEDQGLVLGGEQSGHLVFRHLATTGDGLLSGLLLADLIVRSGRSLADLVEKAMHRVPQLLVSLPVADPRQVVDSESVLAALVEVENELGDRGRVLLRASGTEPLVRVMVEADEEEVATGAIRRLCLAVEQASASRGSGS